jgi:hypothetical protein
MAVAELLRRSGGAADALTHLAEADGATRDRALRILQQERGNVFVGSVIRAIAAENAAPARGGMGTGVGHGETLTLERDLGDEEEPDFPGPMAEELADIPEGATEEVGPATSSSYSLAAVSLSDIAGQLASRDEAGYCGWKESWNYKTSPGGKISAVKVRVEIDIEMPAWTPPPSMLPRAKAEWERSYAALLAHERGHEQLIHGHFDGLADRILGKTVRQGTALFDGAKASLSRASKAYDTKTGHGTKTGTIIDTAIESREIDEKKKEDEARKKQDEAAKGGKKAEVEGVPQADQPA